MQSVQVSRWILNSNLLNLDGFQFRIDDSQEKRSLQLLYKKGRSGFRVYDSGFRDQGSEFRIQSAEFRMKSSEFRLHSLRFRVQGSKLRVFVGKGFRY